MGLPAQAPFPISAGSHFFSSGLRRNPKKTAARRGLRAGGGDIPPPNDRYGRIFG